MKKEKTIKKEILELYKKLNINTKEAEKKLNSKNFFTFSNNNNFSISNISIKKQTH